MKPIAFVLSLALCTLGLHGCATSPSNRILPIELAPLQGDLVDRERLLRAYAVALGTGSRGELVVDSSETAVCSVHPSIVVDVGGMGTMTTVTVAVRKLSNGQWLAQRSYSYPAVVGGENRDTHAQSLLNKSVSFVHSTVRRYCL